MQVNNYKQILTKHFSEISEFRDIQEPVIKNVLEYRNTLCLMPTGKGKSLNYQVAGLAIGKATIVISPLIALMEQQNQKLSDKGLKSFIIHGGIGSVQQYSIIRNLFSSHHPDFLFISPERLSFEGYLQYILRCNQDKVGLVVLDEAHCVSQWGHSFRPSYKMVSSVLDDIFDTDHKPTLLCLTATLSTKDTQEICQDFNIQKNDIFQSESLLRDNLSLHFFPFEKELSKKDKLNELLTKHKNQKIIVYTHRKSSQYGNKELSKEYQDKGFICDYFDADRLDTEKRDILQKFESGDLKIIFATNAFGMGIDIPDIAVVIHFLIPESIEQYYQEVGRAGRNGEPAYGYLFFSEKNIQIRQELLENSIPTKEDILQVYRDKFYIKNPATPVQSFDVWNDSSERFNEMLIIYYLKNLGILQLVINGISTIKCFEINKNTSLPEFTTYKDATKNGLVVTLSKKLKFSVKNIINNLFDWYTQGALKLVNAPSKTIFYSIDQEISEETVDFIVSELEARRSFRESNLEKLAALIKSDKKPEYGICEHLNIPIQPDPEVLSS